jgi:hypothetical protein
MPLPRPRSSSLHPSRINPLHPHGTLYNMSIRYTSILPPITARHLTARCLHRPRISPTSASSFLIRHQTTTQPSTRPQQLQNLSFWKCRHTWRRAMVNTTRCLIGCSLGDLSTMTYLMTYHPEMNGATSMSLSSKYNKPSLHFQIST